jgi:steroid 5-alpha reductase family enzyme
MISAVLLALGLEAAVFTLCWALSVRLRNYAILDVAFSYGLLLLLPLYAALGHFHLTRFAAFASVGALWSLRLGTYILLRVIRHHPQEDVRYQTLRQKWQGPAMFLLFFQMQAVLVVLFSLPVLVAALDPSPFLRPLEIAGLSLTLLGIAGESLADFQMDRFKRNPSHQGQVCQVGLWRYSRHPNYFFESIVWVGFCLASLPLPLGWITLLCPAAMLYFLFRVTGIPLTEEYAIRSKGDAYRAYQRSTNAFFPWFPKSQGSANPAP